MSRFLLAGLENSEIILWEAETGCELTKIVDSTEIRKVNFNVDGSLIVCGSKRNNICIRDCETGELTKKFVTTAMNSTEIELVQFNMDGSKIVTVTTDGMFRVWDVDSGELFRSWGGSFSRGQRFARFTADSADIVTISKYFEYMVWKVELGVQTAHIAPPSRTKACAIPTVEGSLIAYIDNIGKLTVNDMSNDKLCFMKNDEKFTIIKFDSIGEKLLSISNNCILRIWAARTGIEICTVPNHALDISRAIINADGSRLASLDEKNMIHVWDGYNGDRLYSLPMSAKVIALTFGGEIPQYLLK